MERQGSSRAAGSGRVSGGTPLLALESHVTGEMDRVLMGGVDAIYRMQWERAEKACQMAVELNPGHPYGYFGLAVVTGMRYIHETEGVEAGQYKVLIERVNTAVKKGKAWVKTHPEDAEAYMAFGAAQGLLARTLVKRREWVKAFLTARRSMKAVRKAVQLDPELYDAQLGIGMYDYYTDLYPHVVRLLARLMLRGNRARGIEILRRVAEKGHFTKVVANLLLAEIYSEDPFGARDVDGALARMEKVREVYEDSPMLHGAYLVLLYKAGRYEDALGEAAVFNARASSGAYRDFDQAKGHSVAAAAHWMLGEKEKALDSFIKASRFSHRGHSSRWSVWAMIRQGNLLDLAGDRDRAVEAYKKAIQAKQLELWKLGEVAKSFLSQPFQLEDGPLGVLPP